jgi:hypothetical protein
VLFAGVIATTVGSGVFAYVKWGPYGSPIVDARRIHREYTPTGELRLIEYDAHNRHKADTWSYFDHGHVVRTEVDEDGDGVVDTWYYYDAAGEVQKTGSSTRKDGIVDVWRYQAPDGAVTKIEYSGARDGTISRTELYDGNMLVRTIDSTTSATR